VPMAFVNLEDHYASSGKGEELLRRFGLTAEGIEEAAKQVVQKK